MKDLVARLRVVELHPEWYGKLVGDAADAIEAQQAALVKCVEALRTGLSCASEIAAQTHEALNGYLPHKHKVVDDNVEEIEAAIAEAERVLG